MTKKENKIFLGGTCNDDTWRDKLIPLIQVAYFNPVVEDWTEECIEIENIEKEQRCNIHLYLITSLMSGVYSIAEAVDSVSNYPNKTTIFHIIPDGFSQGQLRSLSAVCKIIRGKGGIAYIDEELRRTAIVLSFAFT